MNSSFFDSGIRALHRVIIGTRLLGYKNADPQLIARVLDHADALGFMLMDDFRDFEGEETPVKFRRHLRGIEDAFEGFNCLVASFDENMERGERVPEQARELAGASV